MSSSRCVPRTLVPVGAAIALAIPSSAAIARPIDTPLSRPDNAPISQSGKPQQSAQERSGVDHAVIDTVAGTALVGGAAGIALLRRRARRHASSGSAARVR